MESYRKNREIRLVSVALEKAGMDKKARHLDRAQRMPRNELVSGSFQAGQLVPSFRFTTFPATVFTRFFIALLELKPSEQAIILYLLFQRFHGPLKVIANDLNL